MGRTNYGNGYKFKAVMERRSSIQSVTLRRILKSGKPGAAQEYRLYGAEKTAADVIKRLEGNNPGDHWVEA